MPKLHYVLFAAAALLLGGCASRDRDHTILISVPDQRMALLKKGTWIATYPVSTSKFGVGDTGGSNYTPLGKMEIAKKFGGGAPAGMVFKHRKPTGEVLEIDAPGRDPIVSRILWLRGRETGNQNTFRRYIYIHGTPEERTIGTPASYGCIRMRSSDVISLYSIVGTGAEVRVENVPLQQMLPVVPVTAGAESQAQSGETPLLR